MRKKITFLSVLLVAALLFGMVPFGVFRTEAYAATEEPVEDENPLDVEGSKTADPDEDDDPLTPDNPNTTVTLSLPSAEYKNKVDIVFVMDSSTSIANSNYNFTDAATNLLDRVSSISGIDLKVGVVKFTGYASDGMTLAAKELNLNVDYEGLVKYSEDTKAVISKAISLNNNKKVTPKVIQVPGSGSNIHSGLVMAQSLLANDKDVDDDNKFVILLSDGKSYIWNNSKNEPTSYYAQYYKGGAINSGSKIPIIAQVSGQNREQGSTYASLPYSNLPYENADKFLYPNPAFPNSSESCTTSEYYTWLYNIDDVELKTTNTLYDYKCYYTKYPGFDFSSDDGKAIGTADDVIKPSNGNEVFSLTNYDGVKYSNIYRSYYGFTPDKESDSGKAFYDEDKPFRYLSINPYNLNENGLFDTSSVNEDFFLLHPDVLQKGTYIAGHYWTDNFKGKYHTAVITLPEETVGGGSGLHLAASFVVWLRENCDVSARIDQSQNVGTLFDTIDDSIRYLIGRGVVEDKITDEFTLVEDENNTFTMNLTETVNGEKVVTPIVCKETEDAKYSWVFGKANEQGIYPYTVSYDKETKTITWGINVKVENAKKISLSYDLEINDPCNGKPLPVSIEGDESTYYATNKSAVLTYTSTDGKYKDCTYTFEVPKVKYDKKASYTVNYYTESVGGSTSSDAGSSRDSSSVAETPSIGNLAMASTNSLPGYTLYKSESLEDSIGKEVEAEKINITGFTYNPDISTSTGTVAEDGSLVLDLYYDANKHDVIYKYEGTVPKGAPKVPDTKSYKYQADVTIENTPEMDGYTFSGWNRKDFKMPDNDVTITGSWRVKDTLSYTVRYLEYGTNNPVADAKVIDNQVFDTFVTESAIKVTGYLLRENEDDPKSIQIKDDENVITFLYDAIRSYVVNYLDASTQKPVADPKTGPDQRVSTVVTESAIKVNGYLLKSNETQTLTIVKEASKNVITFLYDKETQPDTPTRPDRPVTPDPDPTDDPEPIDDPDTPLAPPTDDETDIDDPDTPLAPGTIDEETEIDDEETPLSPFTGDNRHTGLWAGISIASLAGIALLSKRRRKPAKH